MKPFGRISLLLLTILLVIGCENTVIDQKPDKMITDFTLPVGFTPALSAVAVTSFSDEQYAGVIEWSPALGDSGTFLAETVYTATITLTAKPGWMLTGIAANAFQIGGCTSITNLAGSGVITVVYPATGSSVSTVTDFTLPVGFTPALSAVAVTSFSDDQYAGVIEWSPALSESGTFLGETVYTATITLTAKPGWTLSGIPANAFQIGGCTSITNLAGSGVITVVYPATGSSVSTVTDLILPSVFTPIQSKSAIKAFSEDQYTGVIEWSPALSESGTFLGETVYTATITLTAKPGWTFSGISANAFQIGGCTSIRNQAGSAVVTVVYPATGSSVRMITDFTLPEGFAPVLSAVAVTAFSDDQYSGVIEWSPDLSKSGTFLERTVYTAHITLIEKPGWTFTGVDGNIFRIDGCRRIENMPNSGNITVYYPMVTSRITDLEINEVTVPAMNEVAVKKFEGEQYTGIVEWDAKLTADGKYMHSTVYTATINLFPNEGWELPDEESDGFTVPGAYSVANISNEYGKIKRVIATFPQTKGGLTLSPNIDQAFFVPKGSFQRDSNAKNISVITRSFWMSRTEICRDQYIKVMNLTTAGSTDLSNEINVPIDRVSWYDALVFCNRLSVKEGYSPVYSVRGNEDPETWDGLWQEVVADWDANGYRLPTEMEWLWAAMGATYDLRSDWVNGINTSGYSYEFSGQTKSNTIDDCAWHRDNSSAVYHPVGRKQVNSLLLSDMSGNLNEWCWDAYADYPSGKIIDYRGYPSGIKKIARGGSWMQDKSLHRFDVDRDYVNYDSTSKTYINIGFRVMRYAE